MRKKASEDLPSKERPVSPAIFLCRAGADTLLRRGGRDLGWRIIENTRLLWDERVFLYDLQLIELRMKKKKKPGVNHQISGTKYGNRAKNYSATWRKPVTVKSLLMDLRY